MINHFPSADHQINSNKGILTKDVSTNKFSINLENVVITGASIGLPGLNRKVFDKNNFDDIIKGTNFIDSIPEAELKKILDKNIKKVVKDKNGNRSIESIDRIDKINRLAGLRGEFDLENDYEIPSIIVDTLDKTYELAIAAGLEALKDAKIPLVSTNINDRNPTSWELPESYKGSTGIIFASSFPVLDALSDEITRHLDHKLQSELIEEIGVLYSKIKIGLQEEEKQIILEFLKAKQKNLPEYQFNRKLLFKLLVMGNAQLAQLIKVKGPNTTLNAACASTSQAVALAEDWIKLGRCERVIVIGADDPSSQNLLQWIGTGFLVLDAASTEEKIENAALPFDRRRNGMILGMGAVGLVVESKASAKYRGVQPLCQILGTHMANSAYHGTSIDINHVSDELDSFISRMENLYGLDRDRLSKKLAYMSHETYTSANGGSAQAEVDALRKVFGTSIENIIISNTKGFTGHPMGVGIEEAVAAYSLLTRKLPPIANFKELDPKLGELKFPSKGTDDFEYILRFAAGFGSQMIYLLFQRLEEELDENRYQVWLNEIFNGQTPEISSNGILKSYLI